MIENLVDVWLTEASERSYEAAFGQLLLIEGYRIVQGPMHHAHEHGKDIIAWSPAGDLCAFQLKGGQSRLDGNAVEQVQGQLTTAAIAPIRHPSLTQPRPPDRVVLVTNQASTGPGQDKVQVLSEGLQAKGYASLQLIEKAELASRFVSAQRSFFPSSPSGLKTFLSLFLADGRGELPREDFVRLLEEILPLGDKKVRAADAARAISSAALTTAFALRQWVDLENHAEVAIGWTCYATQALRLVEQNSLGRARWEASYQLALEEARRQTRELLLEALAEPDLTVPDPAEPLVYAARALKICGLVSALAISEKIEFGADYQHRGEAARLVQRESDCLKILGEVQAAEYFLSVLALNEAGRHRAATQMLFTWLGTVAKANQQDSTFQLASPYHAVEDLLLRLVSPLDVVSSSEDFAGSSYTAHIAVRWVARRMWRQSLNAIWSDVSRLQHFNFAPSPPINYLAFRSEHGSWDSWFYSMPKSWAELRAEVSGYDRGQLPKSLLSCPEFVPFFCVAMPHRFNSTMADHLDELAS